MKNPLSGDQMSLFSSPREYGSSEWKTFNVVRGDHAGAYRVALPAQRAVRYPNILHITRYPRHFTPRPAR